MSGQLRDGLRRAFAGDLCNVTPLEAGAPDCLATSSGLRLEVLPILVFTLMQLLVPNSVPQVIVQDWAAHHVD